MLSRLPILLAQLKGGNNSEKLKNESDNYCILYTDQKTLQKTSIKVWLTLFKTWKRFSWTAKTVKQVNRTESNKI